MSTGLPGVARPPVLSVTWRQIASGIDPAQHDPQVAEVDLALSG
jgi:hypothetical protein